MKASSEVGDLGGRRLMAATAWVIVQCAPNRNLLAELTLFLQQLPQAPVPLKLMSNEASRQTCRDPQSGSFSRPGFVSARRSRDQRSAAVSEGPAAAATPCISASNEPQAIPPRTRRNARELEMAPSLRRIKSVRQDATCETPAATALATIWRCAPVSRDSESKIDAYATIIYSRNRFRAWQ